MSEAPAAKKSPLPLIFAAVVAAVLAGGGVWWFAGNGNDEAVVAEKPPIYHRIEPAFVVNIDDRGTLRYLQVEVQLMTRDPQALTQVNLHAPVVRDALLRQLGRYRYAELITDEGRQQVRDDTLATLRAALPDAAAAERIEAVYFTSFILQ